MRQDLGIDSWAFLESFFEWPRHQDVDDLIEAATRLVTTREIVAETFGSIVYKTRRTSEALAWLKPLRASRILVIEPEVGEIESFLDKTPATSNISYADASLALACRENGIQDIATEDGGFRSMLLTPLFAKTRS